MQQQHLDLFDKVVTILFCSIIYKPRNRMGEIYNRRLFAHQPRKLKYALCLG
jgi:hypothetical protein